MGKLYHDAGRMQQQSFPNTTTREADRPDGGSDGSSILDNKD